MATLNIAPAASALSTLYRPTSVVGSVPDSAATCAHRPNHVVPPARTSSGTACVCARARVACRVLSVRLSLSLPPSSVSFSFTRVLSLGVCVCVCVCVCLCVCLCVCARARLEGHLCAAQSDPCKQRGAEPSEAPVAVEVCEGRSERERERERERETEGEGERETCRSVRRAPPDAWLPWRCWTSCSETQR